jgi:hypothetical protein
LNQSTSNLICLPGRVASVSETTAIAERTLTLVQASIEELEMSKPTPAWLFARNDEFSITGQATDFPVELASHQAGDA